jgi:FkbM family methyltransferase
LQVRRVDRGGLPAFSVLLDGDSMRQLIMNLSQRMRKLAAIFVHRDYRTAFFRAGVAPSIEHVPLLKSLDFATVIDIGANRGQFTLAARRCFPSARIIAFEPLPAPARRFRAALAGDPLVTLHEVAIGPSSGTAVMHVAAEDDSSSLLPITELQQSLFTGTREVATTYIKVESVNCRVTDDDLKQPALLKIDVQGYELPALQGCGELLASFSHVYVECSFVELYGGQALAGEVIDYLYARGFDLRGVYNTRYDSQGLAVQADMLFAARNR